MKFHEEVSTCHLVTPRVKPYLGYYISGTAKRCQEVYRKNPDPVVRGPYGTSKTDTIFIIRYESAKGEQEPTPTETTIEKLLQELYEKYYSTNHSDKDEKMRVMERCIRERIREGKPYSRYAIGGTAGECKKVYEAHPNHKSQGPRGPQGPRRKLTDTIFIIRYESAKGEQEPTPTETTMEKLLQELYEKYYSTNHSDKDEKMRVMEKSIKSKIREGKPYSRYAIGGTAGECKKVYEAHPNHKSQGPSTKKAKKPKVTPDISTERKRKERSDESLSEVGAELKSKKKGRKVMVSVRVDGQVIHQRKLLEAVISDESEASNQQSPVTGRIVATINKKMCKGQELKAFLKKKGKKCGKSKQVSFDIDVILKGDI